LWSIFLDSATFFFVYSIQSEASSYHWKKALKNHQKSLGDNELIFSFRIMKKSIKVNELSPPAKSHLSIWLGSIKSKTLALFQFIRVERSHPAFLVLIISGVVYFGFLTTLSLLSHWGLKTQLLDLGCMDQAIWEASRGNFYMPTSIKSTTLLSIPSRLAIHMNIIFYFIAPLYWIFPHPEILLVLTTLACTFAGFGLYAIGRHWLGNNWWVLVPPLAFWLSPIVHDANLYDFHVTTLATAFFVWMVWSFETGRDKSGWVLFTLALFCKENVSFVLFFYGIYLIVSQKNRKRGYLIIGISFLYLIVTLKILLPMITGGEGFLGPDKRYSWLGESAGEILKTLLTEPGKVIDHIIRPDRLRLPLYLFLSGGLAGLGALPFLMIVAPVALEAVLSGTVWSSRITGTYYWILGFAAIVIACIESVKKNLMDHKTRAYLPFVYLGVVNIIFSFIFSPLPHGIFFNWSNYQISPNLYILRDIKKQIPRDANLCVQNNLGPHFSDRPFIRDIARSHPDFEYGLFHLRFNSGPDHGLYMRTNPSFMFHMKIPRLIEKVNELFNDPNYELVVQKEGFYLFKRGGNSSLSREVGLKQLKNDEDIITTANKTAEIGAWRFSWWLNGKYDWNLLFSKISQEMKKRGLP
jgi:uncharacterized membrane protein